ncbi:IS4 family transposase [Moritella sp.]|uniref:IS4 family transposase n=1 Tax=Moritella sp. TaxID=78556 RepID=UPI001D86451D|nr:IS4 family transposase [Moritella sp.]MCJ8352378.1 IS4 family transposase [Moritella sp.]NRA86464.1 IS4 family transposase [Hyphomicrobiales bacterium]
MDNSSCSSTSWVDNEVNVSSFSDKRLGLRLRKLLGQLSNAIGDPLPMACQDWANTKAAYRFLSNEAVGESEILAGHFQSTQDRVAAVDGFILVLQDTTEFTYKRSKPEKIGVIGLTPVGRDLHGRIERRAICGLLMHGSLVITTDGLPLGLSAVKFWSRSKFKGTNALKRHINPTRIPIEEKESYRWLENMRQSTDLLGTPERLVHIGDRENDIYEFFCAAEAIGTKFLVRTCVNRLSGNTKHTIAEEMADSKVQGIHHVTIGANVEDVAELELKYKQITVLPPIGKQKKYPSQLLTVIHAKERKKPTGRPQIEWKLITNLTINSLEDAIEKLDWYAQRWKIETFHKILKSGCRAEAVKLRTADRLVNLIAIFCILGWRIFWLTMINRAAPTAPPQIALTTVEIQTLDKLRPDKVANSQKLLSNYILKIARLGGYLARAQDPPPGNIVIWRGWTRLNDIVWGTMIGK